MLLRATGFLLPDKKPAGSRRADLCRSRRGSNVPITNWLPSMCRSVKTWSCS